MSDVFGEDYFRSENYARYLLCGDRYIKLAEELYIALGKLGLMRKTDRILDYGCSVGFLLDGFKKLGFKHLFGYDISDWATLQATSKGHRLFSRVEFSTFDTIIMLDVLEHMHDEDIEFVLSNFESSLLVARIPVSVGNETRFYLDISNNDKTHINKKNKRGWKKLLSEFGYDIFLPLNLYTVYDSKGVMAGLFLNSKRLSYEQSRR